MKNSTFHRVRELCVNEITLLPFDISKSLIGAANYIPSSDFLSYLQASAQDIKAFNKNQSRPPAYIVYCNKQT